MKKTVSEHDFLHAFEVMGRQNQFSREALLAMFEWIEDREQDMGEEIELDVIALCCEWAEYDSAKDAAEEYGWEVPAGDEGESAEEYAERLQDEALDWLEGQTEVIRLDSGGVVLVQF